MTVYRISQLTCMGCGAPQRCRIRLEDETEIYPHCWNCERNDLWMSVPKIDVEEQRREIEADTTSSRMFVADALLSQSIVAPDAGYARFVEYGTRVPRPMPPALRQFLQPSIDEVMRKVSREMKHRLLYGDDIPPWAKQRWPEQLSDSALLEMGETERKQWGNFFRRHTFSIGPDDLHDLDE